MIDFGANYGQAGLGDICAVVTVLGVVGFFVFSWLANKYLDYKKPEISTWLTAWLFSLVESKAAEIRLFLDAWANGYLEQKRVDPEELAKVKAAMLALEQDNQSMKTVMKSLIQTVERLAGCVDKTNANIDKAHALEQAKAEEILKEIERIPR